MMTHPSFAVQHLFLLMGDNPLPNAVAALTLLEPAGTPYLVHTRKTQLAAERLEAVLREFPQLKPAQLIDLDTFQANSFEIRQRLQARAAALMGTVGINYTGGTKVMSVHATRAIETVHPNAVFSYLDSNTLEMLIDRDNAPGITFKPDPKLTLGQLFRLHGLFWRDDQPPLRQPVATRPAAQLARLFSQSRDTTRAWKDWCHNVLRSHAKHDNRWKPEWQLAQLSPLPIQTLPEFLRGLLRSCFRASDTALDLRIACQEGNFASITQLCEWLDGIWLEHYVLHQIQQIALAADIHDSRLGFHIAEPTDRDRRWDKFEFDVAFVRHYQLFALSCTTSNQRKWCKQKLLEASTRARQLGGVEARVALVCCNRDVEGLRSELEVETRDRKIAVFGRQDLPTLGEKIAHWVEWNG